MTEENARCFGRLATALSKRQLKRRQAKRKSEADPDLLSIASRKSSGTGSGLRPREGNETAGAESAVDTATVQGSTAVQASPVDRYLIITKYFNRMVGANY